MSGRGLSCPADFSVQKRAKGQRWLRFSATIVNVGAGPFQAYGHSNVGGELSVDQQFRTSGNSTTARIRINKNGVTVLDPGTGP